MAWLGDHLKKNWLIKHWRIGVAIIGMSPAAIAALCFVGLPLPALLFAIAGLVAANLGFARTIVRNTATRLESAEASEMAADAILALAHSDPVTGLLNRPGGEARLQELAEELSEGEKVVLMWIDLRRFREANNALGHARGDNLLKQVGQRLRDTAPADALIARFSGDRFLLTARLSPPEDANQLAHRINETMAAPLHIGGHKITNGASIGVAFMPRDARCLATLQEAADVALYHARMADHAEMRFHDASMIRAFDLEKQVEAELRDAIMKNDLSVVFQPLIDLRSGRIRAFEGQARWFHPSRGELPLDQIIAEGSAGGLEITTGNWTIAEAAKAASAWADDVRLAVTMVPAQIMAPSAALGVLAALEHAALSPKRLEVQISGSILRDPSNTLAEFMAQLGAKGVRFAVDDNDTSRAAIEQIGRHPFQSIRTSCLPDSDVSFRAMASLGRSLDLEIVAVDIDTACQLQTARAAGCSLAMGQYVSGAVTADIALELLAQEDGPAVVDAFSARKLAG